MDLSFLTKTPGEKDVWKLVVKGGCIERLLDMNVEERCNQRPPANVFTSLNAQFLHWQPETGEFG